MMLNIIDFQKFSSILCLNGDLPDRSFFDNLKLPIIAADGAANSLQQFGIYPEIIIGDLDSVTDSIRENNKVLHLPDQNSTDFHKSINYMKENNLLPAIIMGINGGNLDHVLNNINIFLNIDSVLYSPPIIGYVLKEKISKRLVLPFNTKISLLGIPAASVTSVGLKWELNKSDLSFPGKNSCFNRTLTSSIQLEVHHGSVLILIYTDPVLDAGL